MVKNPPMGHRVGSKWVKTGVVEICSMLHKQGGKLHIWAKTKQIVHLGRVGTVFLTTLEDDNGKSSRHRSWNNQLGNIST